MKNLSLTKKIWLLYITSIMIPVVIFILVINGFSNAFDTRVREELTAREYTRDTAFVTFMSQLITDSIDDDGDLMTNKMFLRLLGRNLEHTLYQVNLSKNNLQFFKTTNQKWSDGSSTQLHESNIISGQDTYQLTIIKTGKSLPFKNIKTNFLTRNVPLISFLILLYVALHLIFFKFAKNIFIKPLNQVKEASLKIKNGDLQGNFDYQKKDEIGQVYEAFDSMRVQLKESQKIQKQYEDNRKELISNISHDLKTPITAINGYVQGIIDGVANTDEKLNNYVNTINSYVKDMDTLIDDLFLFSKLDIQQLPFDFELVNIIDYLHDCIEEYDFDFQQRGITSTFESNGLRHMPLLIDPKQIKRVLNNIVYNALNHFDKEKNTIHFEITEDQDSCIISITDNGIGIPKDKLDTIFNRFYRIDPSRNAQNGGSGLGLSIAKQIINAHKGMIWAQSEHGQSTSIHFRLNKHMTYSQEASHEENPNH